MGRGKPRATFKEEKDGEVSKLRAANRRLKSDNEKLKQQIATYEAAFNKNIEFLKGKVKDITLPELLQGAKKGQNLKQIEDTKAETFKEHEQKWKCFVCTENHGVMKITIITRQDGRWYFRKCTNQKCSHRTELKQFTEEVELS